MNKEKNQKNVSVFLIRNKNISRKNAVMKEKLNDNDNKAYLGLKS